MTKKTIAASLTALIIVLTGCSPKENDKENAPPQKRGTIITTAKVAAKDITVTQESIGEAESKAAPFVDTEVSGRVEEIYVDVGDKVIKGQKLARLDTENLELGKKSAEAETKRLMALIENQERSVKRYRELAEEKFISQSMLDDAESSLKALKEQLASAKARLARVRRDLVKATIISPVAGSVEQRLVDEGDYLEVGRSLFRISTSDRLRVRLPFPETMADRLRPGLELKLSIFSAPDDIVEARIDEIRPMVSAGSRAVEAIININNPGGWKPGASVKGSVTLEERKNAVMAPERSVVLRPSGPVAYIIEDRRAHERAVKTGVHQGGMIEIISGLSPGETIALDGASYLTDNAAVTIRERR
ncbi:MAG: efflux RND transporter periplasmic adaptor subunit [Candidatus Nitrospinota bacterium M3_3B_026]